MNITRPERTAFTLVELLVVIAIIAVLAALIMPMMSRVTQQARTRKCANFMRELGIAAIRYAGDHDMTLPVTSHQRRKGGKSWTLTLQEYAEGKVTFRCPCDEDTERAYSYVINDFLTPNPSGAPDIDFSRLLRLEKQSETLLFAEASPEYKNTDHFHFTTYRGMPIPPSELQGQVAVERHLGSANYLFADAHVETLSWKQAQVLLRQPGSRFIDPTAESPTEETNTSNK